MPTSLVYDLWSFFTWRDALEITFYSYVIYHISCWLRKDRTSNLLGYFYGYCALAFTSYAAHLTGITYMICLSAPVIVMLFVLIHQTTLQKNFVTSRAIIPAHKDNTDWIDKLIRSMLIALNNNKTITCLIEHQHSMGSVVNACITLYAHIKEDLLNLIIDSATFDQNRMLWVNTQGKLLGFNATWQTTIDDLWITDAVKKLPHWQQQGLFFTTKTDAVIVRIDATKRTFDIIAQGTIFDNVTTSNAVPLIKKYVMHSHSSLIEKGLYVQSKNNVVQQHHS